MGCYDHPACCCFDADRNRSITDDGQPNRSAGGALCRLQRDIQLKRLVASQSEIQINRSPSGSAMLHSPDLARPFQLANAHWRGENEKNNKKPEGARPLICYRDIFQESLAPLPPLTYQAGQTIHPEGSRTDRLLILRKGEVAIVKDGTEIAKVAESGAVFGELSVLLDQPHTADVRAVEPSQFHVANAATLFAHDAIAVLYVATVLA